MNKLHNLKQVIKEIVKEEIKRLNEINTFFYDTVSVDDDYVDVLEANPKVLDLLGKAVMSSDDAADSLGDDFDYDKFIKISEGLFPLDAKSTVKYLKIYSKYLEDGLSKFSKLNSSFQKEKVKVSRSIKMLNDAIKAIEKLK